MNRQGGSGDRRIGQRTKGPLVQVVGRPGRLEVEIGKSQLLQVIASVSGGQQIGSHLRIKPEAAGDDPLRQQGPPQRLQPVYGLPDASIREQDPQKIVVAVPLVRKKQGRAAFSLRLLPRHAHHIQRGQGQHAHPVPLPPKVQKLLHPVPAVHRLADAGTVERLPGAFLLALGRGESVFVNELGKLQVQEQLVQGVVVGLPAQVLLRIELDWGVGVDGGQVIGHSGHLLPLRQLFHHTGLGRRPGGHLRGGHGGIQGVNGMIPLDQGHGGLFPHPLDPGDIVGAVPHQGLQVHNVDGIEAVLLPEGVRGHIFGGGAAHAGGHQLDGGGIGDQLERVLVPRDDHRRPAGGGVLYRDGADEIIGLPAVQLIHGDFHGRQHLLQQRHLTGQLVWHPLPLGLIALIGQMAEGGGLSVKGDAQGIRLLLVQQLIQNIQKPKDRIGGLSRPGGEILAHPIKGPVDNGVAIQNHQLFHVGILPFPPYAAKSYRP